ncbi:MAG: hypothetical protein LBC85_02575 [Fibromonadaceae bacterium]|nr:hypothetical protein [Fibromonadaceae bacterium]
MKKVVLILAMFLLIFSSSAGQGLNNDFQFDNEDMKNIFELQGISVFKFPFELKKGEYISISYCIYENGIEKERHDLIEDFQIDAEIRFDHHLSRNDTTIFHRIYFMNQSDSILSIRVIEPGISMNKKVDIIKVGVSGFTASLNIEERLPYKRDIVSFYALYLDSEKYNKNDGWLPCPTGKSPEKLVDECDFVLIFYAERITKERVKNILEEDYYKLKNENASR